MHDVPKHAWMKDPFKVLYGPMDCNVAVWKVCSYVLRFYGALTFEKLALGFSVVSEKSTQI